jgi:SAM-dependent methyltransferase
MARFYDLFVDWEGRLGREMPGLRKQLDEAGARRILDAGCGTGRHVAALLEEGYDAHGSDLSEEMLDRAREFTGRPERFHAWALGDDPPAGLLETAPFDAILCLGNTWPQILPDAGVASSLDAFRRLLRPGGLILIGLKAVAVRRDSGDPYMPILRREREGRPVWFIRFVEFPRDDRGICDFHMVVVGGEDEALLHVTHRMRVWSPETLAGTFTDAGFVDVTVSGRLDDPSIPPTTEDVFLHARR